MSLTPDDLAYMRETQAESRPTPATLFRKTITRTATGGQTSGYPAEGQPVDVRLDGSPDQVPAVVAAQYEGGTAVKVVLDLVADVRSGDRLVVSATEAYEFVSDGDPDRWATAQVAWARRYLHPART